MRTYAFVQWQQTLLLNLVSLLASIEVCCLAYNRRVRETNLYRAGQQTDQRILNLASSKQHRYINRAVSSVLLLEPFSQSKMSDDLYIDAIQGYDTATDPYIRGLCGEICDHLKILAEAWRPPNIKIGDIDNKFPGYAKGAQEASEVFGSCIQELEDAIDILFDLADGLPVGPCKLSRIP